MENRFPEEDQGRLEPESVTMILPVTDGELCLQSEVPAGPCDLASIVPAAARIASQLASLTVSVLRRRGVDVPCRKGCCACCHYLVPLTVPEATAMRRAIDRLPRQRRERIYTSLENWARSSSLPTSCHPQSDESGSFGRHSARYAHNQQACPLLSEGLCTLYAARPIACREHSVTTPPKQCRGSSGGTPTPVITSVFEALARLHSEIARAPIEVVLMPSLHTWWKEQDDHGQTVGTGPELLRRMGRLLADQFNRFVARRAG